MEEEKKEPKKRGGYRPNAGRPAKGGIDGTQRVAFRASKDVWAILQQVENKTEFIEKAIREKWRRMNYNY